MVEEAFERNPAKVERPETPRVEESVVAPETVRVPKFVVCAKRFVEEAVVEKKLVEVAFARVVLPETVRVEVAVRVPARRSPPKIPEPPTESSR